MARTMTNVLQIVNSIFSTAIKTAYPGFTSVKGTIQGSGPGGKFGDYKCMVAMPIAQVSRHCNGLPIACLFYSTAFCTNNLFPNITKMYRTLS